MAETVKIYSVVEVPEGLREGGEPARIEITYATPDVPPRTVYVEKDKDSPEERQRVIKADLEAARAQRGEFLDIP